MPHPAPDLVFQALTESLDPRTRDGLVEIRRSGDEAVLMFRWRPHRQLFGVPVALTHTDRRMDWDQPAVDLDDWVESVALWLMEDVENGFLYRARRRLVDDYLELRGPDWPSDPRFYVDVVDPSDQDSWLRTDFVARDGLDPRPSVARREAGDLVAWCTAYEDNSTGSPYVGQATVVRETPTVARLDHLELTDDAPATLVLDIVRTATHAAADAGATTVVTSLALEHLDVAGFRPGPDGRLTVDTRFIDEDPDAAEALLRDALAQPGSWGRDRDRAGRVLPATWLGRLVHRLRRGQSGGRARTLAG